MRKAAGARKKERKEKNHASDYFTQPVEEINLVQPAPDWAKIEINGQKCKMQKDSAS